MTVNSAAWDMHAQIKNGMNSRGPAVDRGRGPPLFEERRPTGTHREDSAGVITGEIRSARRASTATRVATTGRPSARWLSRAAVLKMGR